jgi:DNA-binding transcriptional ArsR family regulator
MPLSRRRVTDAAALKALAHPVRLALLELLMTAGPHTATEAAAALEQTPANCSWHLRKLGEHGFVREAAGATGRHRPWRVVAEGLTWGDPGDAESAGEASDALTDMLLERELQRLRAARAAQPHEPAAWQAATGLHHALAWVTPEEAAELSATFQQVLTRHAHRSGPAATRPKDARLVSLVAWLAPSGPLTTREQPAG